jgi:hypothetical protein
MTSGATTHEQSNDVGAEGRATPNVPAAVPGSDPRALASLVGNRLMTKLARGSGPPAPHRFVPPPAVAADVWRSRPALRRCPVGCSCRSCREDREAVIAGEGALRRAVLARASSESADPEPQRSPHRQLQREPDDASSTMSSFGSDPATMVAGLLAGLGPLSALLGWPVRIPLPKPVPMCGKTLTHIEIPGPPRWRDLEPCKPKGFLVYRLNIIGRDTTVSPKGSQVFNLHIGIYRDPTTNRLCGIVDDSKKCVCPRCVELGCFPTLKEVLDAIIAFLKLVLIALGLLLLAALIAAIIELILVPAAAAALMLASASPDDPYPTAVAINDDNDDDDSGPSETAVA